MQLLGNLKIHFLALVLTVVAEFIGIKKLGPVVLLPLLYTLILGLLISIPKFKILTIKQMEKSADYIGIAVMILMVKVGLGIGPNLGILTSAGWALLLQELGHFFGTIVFGLPVALLVGMRREAVGACYSVDREPNVAIIIDKFGFSSPEGRGDGLRTAFGPLEADTVESALAQFEAQAPRHLMGDGEPGTEMREHDARRRLRRKGDGGIGSHVMCSYG